MKGWNHIVNTGRRGFTIVELLIVIVVIAVLASILVVGYGAVQNNAHDASVKADLQNIDTAFKQYALDNEGVFPDTAAELTTLDLKINQGSYYTANKANLYVCVNATSTEYAVVAMSLSGKRFMVKSESGISDYTASVTWDATTANWATTCSGADASYVPGSGNLTGMEYQSWMAWTGESSITNLFTNPSFESSTTNALAYGGISSLARVSTWASNGTYSVLLTPSTASPASALVIEGDLGTFRNGMQAGKTYTASGTIRLTAPLTGTLDARARSIYAFYKNAGGSYISTNSAQAPNTAGETRLSVTFSIPADATEAFIRFYNGASSGGGAVQWDGLMLTEGSTLYDYGDGSTNGWYWTGTSNISTSVGPPL